MKCFVSGGLCFGLFCLNTLVAMFLLRGNKIKGMCSAFEMEGDGDSDGPCFL